MELKLPTPEQLRTVYDTQMKKAFPAAELKPLRAIEEMWRDGWYLPWCLFDGTEIAGACFLWLGEPGWALLDYLCVSSRRRNSGIGALLITRMLAEKPETVILAESELPTYAPDPAMAERRLGFYTRNGARLAGYDSEMFGVPYKTLYWAGGPVPDAELMAAHQFIYRNRFSPEKYARHIRIPRQPDAQPLPRSDWSE